MSTHDIRLQSWGRTAVATCETCPAATPADRAILRATTADGFTYAALVAAIELHTGEGANRALIVTSERVEGQVEFGPQDPDSAWANPPVPEPVERVAFGDADEYPAGYHQRTGQRLPESLDPSARPGGGDPLTDYLHQKGEL
jgi:hypothetical protein